MKKTFMDGLPIFLTKSKNKINWIKSIGCIVPFIYEEIEGELFIMDYSPKTHKVSIKYLNHTFLINTDSIIRCNLGDILGVHTKKFKVNIGTIFNNYNRNILITDRGHKNIILKDNSSKTFKYYKYKCNNCGWDQGYLEESKLLKGIGCSCCANKTVVQGINDIPTTAPWMVKYFQGGYDEAKLYIKTSKQKIKPICPDCGRIKDKEISIYSININNSIGCYCSDGKSYPEKFIYNLLEQLGIDFTTEFTPEWCKYSFGNKIKQGRYDFYFTNHNKRYLLEVDGEQHIKGTGTNSNWKNLESQQYIDSLKNVLAKRNGFILIRIDCKKSNLEWMKNSINKSKLYNLYSLSNIKWKQCEDFALSNRVKEINLLWNQGYKNTAEISKMVKLSRPTVIDYLKRGSKIGWSNYNAKGEMIKRGESYGKEIICVTNGMTFKSASECSRQSEGVFGIKLHTTNISSVCRHEQKHTKGFVFEFL